MLWIAYTSCHQALRSHTRGLTLAPNLFYDDQVEEIVFAAFFIAIATQWLCHTGVLALSIMAVSDHILIKAANIFNSKDALK